MIDANKRRQPQHSLSLYQQLCNSFVLPVGDLLFGQRVTRRFHELLDFQWKTLEEIEQHRTAKLRELLAVSAARVPYYTEQFNACGLDEKGIAEFTLDDLPRLPILGKTQLRERYDDLLLQGHTGRVDKMMSSGSTGTQTSVVTDRACFNEVYATQLLFWSWGGFWMGAPHLQTGMSLKRGWLRRIKDTMFRCTYTSAFDLTEDKLDEIVDRLKRQKITSLFGYASSLYVIARHVQSRNVRISLNCIFTWGDSLFPHYRELIEDVFGCAVNDCYGLGEGLQCAAQCEEHDMLHEAMHGVILEIVDGDGQPCPTGELGRVVATRLEPGPMPLIRYDTGDVAHFVEGDCPCGRQLRRISRIQGRSTDIISTPAGDRLIVHFFTQIFEMIPEIVHFQVRQNEPSSITIRYVPDASFHDGVLTRVEQEIREHCRYPLKIEFEPVEEIPLEKSNKRRFVISEVPLS